MENESPIKEEQITSTLNVISDNFVNVQMVESDILLKISDEKTQNSMPVEESNEWTKNGKIFDESNERPENNVLHGEESNKRNENNVQLEERNENCTILQQTDAKTESGMSYQKSNEEEHSSLHQVSVHCLWYALEKLTQHVLSQNTQEAPIEDILNYSNPAHSDYVQNLPMQIPQTDGDLESDAEDETDDDLDNLESDAEDETDDEPFTLDEADEVIDAVREFGDLKSTTINKFVSSFKRMLDKIRQRFINDEVSTEMCLNRMDKIKSLILDFINKWKILYPCLCTCSCSSTVIPVDNKLKTNSSENVGVTISTASAEVAR